MPDYHVYKPVLVSMIRFGMQDAVDKLIEDGWSVGGLNYECVSICDKCRKKILTVPVYHGEKTYHKKCEESNATR